MERLKALLDAQTRARKLSEKLGKAGLSALAGPIQGIEAELRLTISAVITDKLKQNPHSSTFWELTGALGLRK